jgi:hypothetical protein
VTTEGEFNDLKYIEKCIKIYLRPKYQDVAGYILGRNEYYRNNVFRKRRIKEEQTECV